MRDYFCFVYNLMLASIPLLEFASKRADADLKSYFEHHADEERGHVDILKSDLQKMGVDIIPRNISAIELAGAQYYMIDIIHPALLLGYMAALEREVMSESDIEKCEKPYGITFECLRLHSKLDVDHIKELDAQIEKLPVDLRNLVIENESYTKQRMLEYWSKING